MEHRAAPATSWTSKVREDLKLIKETLEDDEKLPDPEETLSGTRQDGPK